MSHIPAALRRAVLERAQGRCEYCQLSQVGQEATFHVDHVHPLADAGPTTEGNLALACVSCSLKKGARIAAPDPTTQQDVRLFNPRQDRWSDHFRWDGPVVVTLSAVGRATAALLDLNRALAVAIRVEEGHRGRHPPG
jgi:HNH endonuclease